MPSAATLFPNLSFVHNWPQTDGEGRITSMARGSMARNLFLNNRMGLTLDGAFAEVMEVNVRSMLLAARASIEPLAGEPRAR